MKQTAKIIDAFNLTRCLKRVSSAFDLPVKQQMKLTDAVMKLLDTKQIASKTLPGLNGIELSR